MNLYLQCSIFCLIEFFSCDITSLINFITTSNSRPDKFIAQRKLIDSIESIMKEKFGTVKCYLIGSHAYSIAKGGLAPIDFYLDLCKNPNFNLDMQFFYENHFGLIPFYGMTPSFFTQRHLNCSELIHVKFETISQKKTLQSRFHR